MGNKMGVEITNIFLFSKDVYRLDGANYLNRNISKKAAKVKKELFVSKESFFKIKNEIY